MSYLPLSETERFEIRDELNSLLLEHRDLDLTIRHLSEASPPNELLMRRLKKRKLNLKDRIFALENLLTPDITA
jgi:hypothetical protein